MIIDQYIDHPQSDVRVTIEGHSFEARWESALAPKTCAAFQALLPYRQKIIHVRWSGEACWVPLGSFDLKVGLENPISRPNPGQLLFYPGGISETEILLAYGVVRFSSNAGELAGNPLLTITTDLDKLAQLGVDVLWNGSREILFESLR